MLCLIVFHGSEQERVEMFYLTTYFQYPEVVTVIHTDSTTFPSELTDDVHSHETVADFKPRPGCLYVFCHNGGTVEQIHWINASLEDNGNLYVDLKLVPNGRTSDLVDEFWDPATEDWTRDPQVLKDLFENL